MFDSFGPAARGAAVIGVVADDEGASLKVPQLV